mmetsp:Transcript_2180/g.5107  ORF Transcript_2180/g.5107 Transcript_2180/m.5107 type:complete len:624 (+) Transcript_2180:237-2108(+)
MAGTSAMGSWYWGDVPTARELVMATGIGDPDMYEQRSVALPTDMSITDGVLDKYGLRTESAKHNTDGLQAKLMEYNSELELIDGYSSVTLFAKLWFPVLIIIGCVLTYMGHKAAPLARAMIGAMLGGFVVLEFGDPLCSLIASVGLGFAGFLVFYVGMVCLHAYLVFKYFVKQTLAIAGALVGGLAGSYAWNVLIRWAIGFPMGNDPTYSYPTMILDMTGAWCLGLSFFHFVAIGGSCYGGYYYVVTSKRIIYPQLLSIFYAMITTFAFAELCIAGFSTGAPKITGNDPATDPRVHDTADAFVVYLDKGMHACAGLVFNYKLLLPFKALRQFPFATTYYANAASDPFTHYRGEGGMNASATPNGGLCFFDSVASILQRYYAPPHISDWILPNLLLLFLFVGLYLLAYQRMAETVDQATDPMFHAFGKAATNAAEDVERRTKASELLSHEFEEYEAQKQLEPHSSDAPSMPSSYYNGGAVAAGDRVSSLSASGSRRASSGRGPSSMPSVPASDVMAEDQPMSSSLAAGEVESSIYKTAKVTTTTKEGKRGTRIKKVEYESSTKITRSPRSTMPTSSSTLPSSAMPSSMPSHVPMSDIMPEGTRMSSMGAPPSSMPPEAPGSERE